MAGFRGTVQAVLRRNMAAAAVNLISGILVARGLGPAPRGHLAVMVALTGITAVVCAGGSNIAIRHMLPRAAAEARPAIYKAYLHATAVVLGLQVIVVLILLGAATTFSLYALSLSDVVAASVLGGALVTSTNALDLLNAQGRLTFASGVNLAGSLLQLVLVGAIYVLQIATVPLVAICLTLAFALQTSFGFGIALKGVAWRAAALPDVSEASRRLRRLGFPATGLNFGQVAAYRMDRLFLGALASPVQVGLYSIASTPAETLRMPSTAISQVLMHRGASESGMSVRHVRRTMARTLLGVTVLGALLAVASPWVVPFLFGEAYRGSVPMLQVLVVAEVALVPFQLIGRLLSAHGHTRDSGAVGLAGAAASLVAIPPLVAVIDGMGAAAGTVISYATMSLYALVRANKRGLL